LHLLEFLFLVPLHLSCLRPPISKLALQRPTALLLLNNLFQPMRALRHSAKQKPALPPFALISLTHWAVGRHRRSNVEELGWAEYEGELRLHRVTALCGITLCKCGHVAPMVAAIDTSKRFTEAAVLNRSVLAAS
jgi:hypothetical protein